MGRNTVVLLVTVLGVGGTALRAQEPPQADSLRREVQRLTARIDSLERLVRQLVGEKRDTTAAQDELAALRTAAAEPTRQRRRRHRSRLGSWIARGT